MCYKIVIIKKYVSMYLRLEFTFIDDLLKREGLQLNH